MEYQAMIQCRVERPLSFDLPALEKINKKLGICWKSSVQTWLCTMAGSMLLVEYY